ncbi:MAG TPA: TPM domain-containing protein [Thermoanaerobaculia bacterium]|jgi:uncharacterized membrane protein YgcG
MQALLVALIVFVSPAHHVIDHAGVLDRTRAVALDETLAQYERESSNNVVVTVYQRVPAGRTPEEMAAAALRQPQSKRRALLLLFVDDATAYLAAGERLRGVLTNIEADAIVSQLRTPLRAGDYTSAAGLGATAIIRTLKTPPRQTESGGVVPWSIFILVAAIITVATISASRTRQHAPRGASDVWPDDTPDDTFPA